MDKSAPPAQLHAPPAQRGLFMFGKSFPTPGIHILFGIPNCQAGPFCPPATLAGFQLERATASVCAPLARCMSSLRGHGV